METIGSRTNEQVMEFQQTLLKVEQSLNREDVEALVFLCADLLEKDVGSISSGRDLFTQLQELDLLTPEQPNLLVELLLISKRNGLLRQLELLHLQPEGRVSPYRKLLFDLSENITSDDLKRIKFLLYETLPRRKLEDDVTMLRLLLSMEKEDHLSDTNLETLEKIILPVCPVLGKMINQYKLKKAIQETGAPCGGARPVQPEGCSAHQDQRPPSNMSGASSFGQPVGLACAHENEDQFGFRRGEPVLPAQPYASSEEPHSLSSHPSANVPESLDTPDARMEGLSLGQMSDSGRTDSAFSSVQSNDVCFTSSCEEKNLNAAEPFPGNKLEMEAYAMREGKTRGVCLIINNHDFSQTSHKNRDGTDIDEECLVKVFEWLGFQTRRQQDCSRREMCNVLAQLGKEDHSDMDCLVVCVLSHGDQGVVFSIDGDELPLRELTQPFSGSRCASLRGKPKLFFIQACQGRKEQMAVAIVSDGPEEPHLTRDAVADRDFIPEEADFLLGMSTVPEFASFRHKKEGSWFIQSLCENLLLLVPSGHDLLSILTKVNHHVSGKTAGSGIKKKKQMPQPAFSLRKRVVFPVPRQPPPKLK